VNGTTLRDLRKAFPLRLVEVTFNMNIARNFFNKSLIRNVAILAIVGVNVGKIIGGAYGFQWNFLVLAIPGNCHAGTGGKGT
jgi:hypothetical protein